MQEPGEQKPGGIRFRSIHAIKRKLHVTDNVDTVFADALEARNFLAHRLFPHYGLKVHNPTGRDEMVAHIDKLRDTIWSACTVAGAWASLLVAAVKVLAREGAGKSAGTPL